MSPMIHCCQVTTFRGVRMSMRRRGWRLAVSSLIVLHFALPNLLASSDSRRDNAWQPTWVAAPQLSKDDLAGKTIRMMVRSSIGTDRVRIEISNAYGKRPLSIGAAHIALRDRDSAVLAGSDRALLFNGKGTVDVPPGVSILSDPVFLHVNELSDIAVSLYVTSSPGTSTMHL